MDPETIKGLIDRPETATLDFKAEPHRLDNDHFKSRFIKDILAMVNTVRETSSFIIVGVKLLQDGTRKLVGVQDHPDDADLQQILNKADVRPQPRFSYQPITCDGMSMGVIEIPLQQKGPFVPNKDFGLLRSQCVYFRRGTQNADARPDETKEILSWFDELAPTRASAPQAGLAPIKIQNWDEFNQDCHNFGPGRLYAALIGPDSSVNASEWKYFGRLPISLVLDFNPSTEDGGAYGYAHAQLRERRSLHLLTLGNEYSLIPEKACYWYAARGLSGRDITLVPDENWRGWNRKYGIAIEQLLKDFARSSSGRPLTVVCLWPAPEYVREVCTGFDRAFGSAVEFVFATPEAQQFSELANQFGGKAISVSLEDVLQGIAKNVRSEGPAVVEATLPTVNGGLHAIAPSDLNWLSEDMTVIHSRCARQATEGRSIGVDFLRGHTVEWNDLDLHFDADRDKTRRLQDLVERELKTRTTARLNLYHWPGAGGTTIGRRIAWNLHGQYPTVILHQAIPSETVGRFRELFKRTSLPTLAILEGADTKHDQIERLYSELKAENIPVVFLSIVRRFDTGSESERIAFLGQNLSLEESYRFAEAYKRVVNDKADVLACIMSRNDARDRTPFYFALAAFGRDYTGLARYVESRLEVATDTQRALLTYIALAYYYGHKAVVSQVFARHLGHPENRPLRLAALLAEPQVELLVVEGDERWRPAHQLIAEQILEIVLSGRSTDCRIWKRSLSTWAIEFIKICNDGTSLPNDDVVDLLSRIFVLRNEHELLGTEGAASAKFAKLIEDVPVSEGRLAIFKELVTAFPQEAHFWGHLGRLYSIDAEEQTEAIKAMERAISLSPDDPVLYHMKGMCYRRLAYEKMKHVDNTEPEAVSVREIQDVVQEAKIAFAMARGLDLGGEHGYVSAIQLLLGVIDFGYKISKQPSRSDFLTSASSSWYREQLDEVQNLMEGVRGSREGDRTSNYVLECQAKLDQTIDNYARALEGWNNLLDKDVYAPPIRRQIVRAYLGRQNGRDWSHLPANEIERIVDLMQANLREEPSNENNVRLWLQAVRNSSRQDVDVAIEKLANWKAIGDTADAYFYLYVLHALKAMDGSLVERARTEELLQQSQAKSRILRNRTRSYEWFGKGQGLRRLRHHSELGEWDEATNFYNNTKSLARVEGRVVTITRPEAGYIELSSGLKAFFVPARSGVTKGRDENLKVSFYLGFSYDGLRAWSVEPLSQASATG